jgi:DNA-binding MarR family transcriptional regulator
MPDSSRVDVALRRTQTDAYLDLFRISRVILARSERLLAEAGFDDLTPAQSNVLMLLFQEKRPMTAREVAASLEVSEVTVSRFVKAMEKAGWIERRPDPADARARLIQPTARALAAIPALASVSNAVLDQVFSDFSRDEIARMSSDIARIRDNLDE